MLDLFHVNPTASPQEQLEEEGEEDGQDGEPMMVHSMLLPGSNFSSESGDSLPARPRISILQYRGSYV